MKNQATRHSLKIFTGNAHPALAKEICAELRVPLGKAQVGRFPDGEVRCFKFSRMSEGRTCFRHSTHVSAGKRQPRSNCW